MARKKSESSAPVKRVAKKGSPTKQRRNKSIYFSDIPELTDAQLMSMRRVGRPPIGEQARQLIAIRVDPKVLMLLQAQAKRQDKGYQTLINEILAEHVEEAI
jgi:uncharacterized protein (DUF4415 family)